MPTGYTNLSVDGSLRYPSCPDLLKHLEINFSKTELPSLLLKPGLPKASGSASETHPCSSPTARRSPGPFYHATPTGKSPQRPLTLRARPLHPISHIAADYLRNTNPTLSLTCLKPMKSFVDHQIDSKLLTVPTEARQDRDPAPLLHRLAAPPCSARAPWPSAGATAGLCLQVQTSEAGGGLGPQTVFQNKHMPKICNSLHAQKHTHTETFVPNRNFRITDFTRFSFPAK